MLNVFTLNFWIMYARHSDYLMVVEHCLAQQLEYPVEDLRKQFEIRNHY